MNIMNHNQTSLNDTDAVDVSAEEMYLFEVWLSLINAYISIVIAALSCIINGLVLVIFYKDPLKCFRTPSGYLVLSLVLADGVATVTCIPLCAAYYYLYSQEIEDDLLLTIYNATTYCPINAASVFTLVIALSQYIAIKKPIYFRSLFRLKNIKIINCATWLYALIFCLLPFFGVDDFVYFSVDLILNYLIPCLFLSVMGFLTYRLFKTHTQTLTQASDSPKSSKARRRIQQQRQIFLSAVLVFAVYVVSWAPWLILEGLGQFGLDLWHDRSYVAAYYITEPLAYTNNILNPIIYAWKVPKYRQSLMVLLKRLVRRHRTKVGLEQHSSYVLEPGPMTCYTPDQVNRTEEDFKGIAQSGMQTKEDRDNLAQCGVLQNRGKETLK